MKSMVAQIDLVIECRDYRTPIVSRNPLFEANLGERPRLIVYTKQDLGSNFTSEDRQVRRLQVEARRAALMYALERKDNQEMGCTVGIVLH